MAYIEGHAREQALLLPASVEDYVGADGPVRFIDVFVDDLDLAEAGFVRAQPKATGRPGYHPADMLKLYLYGYLNRVRSSRRLEAEATRNLELIWLLRGLRPDYKTIADFRRDNRGAFKAVFRAFVTLCRRLDLFGRELLAVDGTRLKAVNNPGRNFSSSKLARYIAAADERLEGYLAELDGIYRGEDGHGPGRREALTAKIATVRARRLGFLDEGRRWTPWQVRPGAVPGAIGRETCADLLVIAGQSFSRPIVSLRSNAPVADLADGLLGLGIIQRLDWIVDRVTASLWIKPNDRKVAPQSYNRSGILVDPAADGGGILEVGAGSPAGRAGIMKGDHIVGMTTPDIEHALAGPVGKAVTLDIDRDGATKSVSFELTDFLQILSPIPANSTY